MTRLAVDVAPWSSVTVYGTGEHGGLADTQRLVGRVWRHRSCRLPSALKVRPAGAGPLSAKVSAALASTSVATTEPETSAASSATLKLAAWATGASLVPVTVMTRLAVDVAPWSSVTVYGTVSTADWPTPSDW